MASAHDVARTARGLVDNLAEKYREPLVRWFQRRGLDRDAAEDCAHETFARLCSTGSQADRPEAYLFAIAGSVFTDRWRRASVRHEDRHVPIADFDTASEEPTPARVFESREALLQLAAALNELPDRTRDMFLLNRLDRLSYTQLAVRFGISVSAVEKHMMKAIAHLHARCPRDG